MVNDLPSPASALAIVMGIIHENKPQVCVNKTAM